MKIQLDDTLIEDTHQDNPPVPLYFENGDKWTGYTENDIFGNCYFEAVDKKTGKPYRITSLPSARLFL
jgi:hypothetical protein